MARTYVHICKRPSRVMLGLVQPDFTETTSPHLAPRSNRAKRGATKSNLVTIDGMGLEPCSNNAASISLEVEMRCYEHRATVTWKTGASS
jgi:hypothetical protein